MFLQQSRGRESLYFLCDTLWQRLPFRLKFGRTLCLLCCYLSTCHPAEIKFPLKAPWNYTFFFFFSFLFSPSLPSPSDLQDKYHNLSLLSCLACGLDDILAMPSVFLAFSSLGQTQRTSEAYCMSLTFLEVQASVVYFVKPLLMEVLLMICSAIVSLWHSECGSAVLSCPCVWLQSQFLYNLFGWTVIYIQPADLWLWHPGCLLWNIILFSNSFWIYIKHYIL